MIMKNKNNKIILIALFLLGVVIGGVIKYTANHSNIQSEALAVSDDPRIIKVDAPTFVTYLNEGTRVLYLGSPTCKYCKRSLPVVEELMQEESFDVYYLNTDTSISGDDYNQIEETMKKFLPSDGKLRIPLFIGVKDGKVVDAHLSLVAGVEIVDENSTLTDEQYQQLRQIYLDIIKNLRGEE